MIKFEIVKEYEGKQINLPTRSTVGSAGYDIEAAEDILIPSYINSIRRGADFYDYEYALTDSSTARKHVPYFKSNTVVCKDREFDDLKNVKYTVKHSKLRTMVPTGLKVIMPRDVVLKIYPRSSIGSNCLLVLANQTGIIDSDYYNNPDNEGHIFIPILNLFPYDIKIKKGEKIAQGIFEHYLITDDDTADNKRIGGFGSTDALNIPVGESKIIGNTMYHNDPKLGIVNLPIYIEEDK